MRDRGALAASARPIKRRRRFRLEEKQAILKAAAEPGATVSEVSRQYGVGRSLIHNWRRQETVAVLGATVRFTPVAVAPERPPGGTIELELDGVNPQRKWAALQNDRRKRVQRVAPDVAQLNFLAAKAETDLEGHASLSGIAPGDYWISTLSLDADAGDMRVRWDVPVKIERGKTMRIELSNLNSLDARSSAP